MNAETRPIVRRHLVAMLMLLVLALAGPATALAETIDVYGPATLDRDGATYVLRRDVTVDGTPFTIAGDDITFDLDGHTITYGEGRSEFIPNPGFEEGRGSVPDDWDLSAAPGARRAAVEKYWGDWELQVDLDAGSPQVVRSSTTTLPPGRTFLAYAWVRSRSGNTATLRVVDPGTGEVLAEDSSDAINRGFAIVTRLKLERERLVRLELDLRGDGTAWCDELDIRPAYAYGIASYTYRNDSLFPDLPEGSLAKGRNLVIRNGTIRQGSARSVRSPAIKAKGPGLVLEDLVLEVNGIDTPVVDLTWARDVTIRDSRLHSSSPAVFNRMSPVGLVNASRTSGAFRVSGCILEGGAQQGISLYRHLEESGDDSSIVIENNEIRNHARVTNGYAIAITGGRHYRVLDNVIEPVYGRGILLDTSGTDGSHRDGEIARNTIRVRERPNHEFGPDGLQAAGIRLRDYPPKGLFDIRIHDNTIVASTGPGLVGEANGITATLRTPGERVIIEGNTVRTTIDGSGFTGQALLLEDSYDDGTVLIRRNILEGNVALVRFGDYDGESTRGLVLEGNTFRRGTPERDDFHAVVYGFGSGTEEGNALLDTVVERGVTLEDVHPVGRGAKDLAIQWTLTVVTLDRNDRPLAGAEVKFLDSEGTETSGTTGVDGRVRQALAQYVRSGASLEHRRELSPYRVVVRYGGEQQERTVVLDEPREEIFHFDVSAGEGPSEVTNLQRTDVH